jgi:hypothetical protein
MSTIMLPQASVIGRPAPGRHHRLLHQKDLARLGTQGGFLDGPLFTWVISEGCRSRCAGSAGGSGDAPINEVF